MKGELENIMKHTGNVLTVLITISKDENSFIYRVVLPVMQKLVLIPLLLALIFNNKLENVSDISLNISMALLFLMLIILAIKELMVKKNKFTTCLYLGVMLAVTIFISYIYCMF